MEMVDIGEHVMKLDNGVTMTGIRLVSASVADSEFAADTGAPM